MLSIQNLIASLAVTTLLVANPAFSDDSTVIVTTASAVTSIDKDSRKRATEANKAAAERAVETILAETRLDLDIRLIGPTSVKIAGDL